MSFNVALFIISYVAKLFLKVEKLSLFLYLYWDVVMYVQLVIMSVGICAHVSHDEVFLL